MRTARVMAVPSAQAASTVSDSRNVNHFLCCQLPCRYGLARAMQSCPRPQGLSLRSDRRRPAKGARCGRDASGVAEEVGCAGRCGCTQPPSRCLRLHSIPRQLRTLRRRSTPPAHARWPLTAAVCTARRK